ncbi:MAG: hypothetical protein AAF909_03280 [Pseudomonadota bacterium]
MTSSALHLLEAFETPQGTVTRNRRDPFAGAFERGQAQGLAEGLLVGRAEGLETGRAEGLETGRAEGRAAGRAEALRETAAAAQAAQTELANAMATALGARAEAERHFAAAAETSLRAALRAVAPRLATHLFVQEAVTSAKALFERAALGSAELRVPPEQMDDARKLLRTDAAAEGSGDAAEEGPDRRIALREDPSLSGAVARLHWGDGLAEFNADAAAERVLELFDDALRGAEGSKDIIEGATS